MSVIDQRDRFSFPRSIGAGWARYMKTRCYMVKAWNCHAEGDLEGFARWKAMAEEPLVYSFGPPVDIADWRRNRQASPE